MKDIVKRSGLELMRVPHFKGYLKDEHIPWILRHRHHQARLDNLRQLKDELWEQKKLNEALRKRYRKLRKRTKNLEAIIEAHNL